MCLPPGIFCCDANNVINVMSILSPSRVTRQTSHFSVARCVALHGDTYHTTHINLHSSRVMSHLTHLTSQFAHILPTSNISIHCSSPCPPVRLPENTGLQPRSLVAHDFKVVFQTLNPKLSDHLNRLLGLLLLVDTKRFSWPRYQFNRGYSAAVFCAICLCELAALRGARC